MRFNLPLSLPSSVLVGVALVLVGLSFAAPSVSAPPKDQAAKTQPLTGLSGAELERRVAKDPASLGSLSVGLPNNGRLMNGVQPSDGKFFEVVTPEYCWGTQETVRYLQTAIQAVHQKHPDTPALHIGHISKKSGGYLRPHLSHQSGRDVDLGFYYKNKRAWYRRGTWKNFDVERNWTLVKALITRTDVEMILVDRSLQVLLRKHAEKIGENKLWLHKVFRGSGDRPAILRHARGHATHFHVRFFSPQAQQNAQRVFPLLLEHELVEPVVVYAHHRVRKGETLGRLARRYGTTVKAIQQANGLRSTMIQARRTYRIPKRGGPAPVEGEIKFYGRLLPPSR